MVTDYLNGILPPFFCAIFLFLFFCHGVVFPPIECFGENSEFLEDITHNNIWGEYVS